MGLEGRPVAIYLTAGGFKELNFLFGLKNQRHGLAGLVRDADGFGIWLSWTGKPSEQIVIIAWRYVRAIMLQFEAEPGKEVRRTIGFGA